MIKTILMLLSFSLAVSGCAKDTVQIEHYLTYSAKGTRSEARHGHLSINGEEIPWAFKTVNFNGKTYTLNFRNHLWGTDGYHQDSVPAILAVSEDILSAEYLSKGYCLANKRPVGLPESWIFVTWGQGESAFVAPDAIKELIKERNILVHPIGEPVRMPLRLE
jgi:hypothetical protein